MPCVLTEKCFTLQILARLVVLHLLGEGEECRLSCKRKAHPT